MFRRFAAISLVIVSLVLLGPLSVSAQTSNLYKRHEHAAQVTEIQGWRLVCRHDPIYATKDCNISRGPLMSRSPLHVFAIRHKDGTINAWVSIITGDSTYPGGPHAIRIDQHPPHTTTDIESASWNGAESKRILAQLAQGHTALTRLISWPYRSTIDHEIPLDGFPAAWQALQHAVRQP